MHKDKIKEIRPPRLGRWILFRILPVQLKSTASGDFEEIYRRILKDEGIRKAKTWYWTHVLKSTAPFLSTTIHWRYTMIKEYLKLTLRHIRRRKGTAIVNIGGLAVGLAACILVFFFIRDEFSYDRFHKHIDSIYEVKSIITYGESTEVYMETQGPVGQALVSDFMEVEAATRMSKSEMIVKKDERIFRQKGIGVDPSFFDIFNFPLAAGNAASVLNNPDSVVLSAESARLLFGSSDPMGEMISIQIGDEETEFEVTGITHEIPANSSLKFDLLLPILHIEGPEVDQWGSGTTSKPVYTNCFIRLSKETDPDSFEAKFAGTIDQKISQGNIKGRHFIFPFADYHQGIGYYTFSSVLEKRSSPAYSYILAGIAFLVLLIAGFNFMNLSVAAAAVGRVKEIGMRKVLGAGRKQLFHQFRFEGMVMSLAALGVGLILASLVLPVFNRFSGKELRLDLLGQGYPVLALVLFSVILGMLAGSYPGWFLSRVRPVDLFRGRFMLGRKSSFNRMFLFFQFGISIFLVITTGFLYRQHKHLIKADLGYVPERVVVLNLQDLTQNFQNDTNFISVLKSQLIQYPEIKSVSGALGGMMTWSAMFNMPKGATNPEILRFNWVDYDFIETLGIELVEGRWFSSEHPSDITDAVVVNETFVRKYNIENPTERTISEFFRSLGPDKIIGVFRDIHFDSLKSEIQPAMLVMNNERVGKVFIRIEGDNLGKAMGIIEQEFKAVAPGYPFLFSYLDEEVAAQYESEQRWSLMVTIVCLFAILIACAGVFALALKTAARRTKEIGVRKVLGASVSRIVGLLAGEFMWTAGAAVLIAWPAAFFAIHKILSDYPYRISISLWMFVAGGVVVAALTLATVSLQALKTAVRNPVESLRHE
ncbi:ABC transporter permease [Acidobacteriota bacterium]